MITSDHIASLTFSSLYTMPLLETGNCSVGVRSYVALCKVWRMRLMSGWEMTAEPPAF